MECLDGATCDLSSLASVQSFSDAYLQSGLPLDSLVECAGIAW